MNAREAADLSPGEQIETHIATAAALLAIHDQGWQQIVEQIEQERNAANARAERAEQERDAFLTYGQGGASFEEAQWIDKLRAMEERAERAEARVVELERVHEAATALCAEVVCDPVRRDVTWFYDGASAFNKVDALHAALDAALDRQSVP